MPRAAQKFRTIWMTKTCLKTSVKLATRTIRITKVNPLAYLAKTINFRCRVPNLGSVNLSSKCSKVATLLQVAQKALNLQPTLRMGNNSKRDSRRIQQFSMERMEIYFRRQSQDLSSQMERLVRMANNLWASVINKIRSHLQRLQQEVSERSKLTRSTWTSCKDQRRPKVIPNHRQQKKSEEVEDPKSTPSALGQITMLALSELAHSTPDNSKHRTQVRLATLNSGSWVQPWALPTVSAQATMDLSQRQQT